MRNYGQKRVQVDLGECSASEIPEENPFFWPNELSVLWTFGAYELFGLLNLAIRSKITFVTLF